MCDCIENIKKLYETLLTFSLSSRNKEEENIEYPEVRPKNLFGTCGKNRAYKESRYHTIEYLSVSSSIFK